MTELERAKRNQKPTPEAVFAMYHWHDAYAAQRGGSMDFYDTIGETHKTYCRRAVAAITEAARSRRAKP